jgi:hypothetical protein
MVADFAGLYRNIKSMTQNVVASQLDIGAWNFLGPWGVFGVSPMKSVSFSWGLGFEIWGLHG